MEAGLLSQIAGGLVNIILSALKIYIGTITNCISILSDGINNLADFAANVSGGAGIALEKKKPTQRHPHGFGRVEDIVSFVMLIVVAIVGFFFIYFSVERLFYHPPIFFAWWSFGVIAATAAVKMIMYFGYAWAYKKNPSPVIKINKIDCILDAAVTLMTLLSYGVSVAGTFPVDSVVGIMIGVLLFAGVIVMLKRNISSIIGDDLPAKRIAAAMNDKGINVLNVKAHSYGRRLEGTVITDSDSVTADIRSLMEKENIFVNIINIRDNTER